MTKARPGSCLVHDTQPLPISQRVYKSSVPGHLLYVRVVPHIFSINAAVFSPYTQKCI